MAGQYMVSETRKNTIAKIMSVSSYRRAETRFGFAPVCKHCNELIRVGQRYYSPKRRNHGRRYHWTCAEGL